ncbi:MAG TPA: hypothetical protein VHN77_05495 [Phycisphaerales bacterium]|nr:hypothetical protein [Phycisphaerales bacterium]
MSESYRALCTDFYVNQKVGVKMELPRTRETILDLFERVRKQFPAMTTFRRYRDELALESAQTEMPHRWMAVRGTSIRSGTVNAAELEEAYALHRQVLALAPNYLSISPLDVDFVELLYGFDIHATGNHDAIVLDALLPGSPLAALLDIPDATPADYQPLVGVTFGPGRDVEVYFEVKTRPPEQKSREPDGSEPISVYLTLRKFGAVSDMKDLPSVLTKLSRLGERLIEERVVPGLLVPIREALGSGNA